MIGSLLQGAGNFLDLPGSMVRDAIALQNPFDQVLTPFSGNNRTSGRDLLRRYGLASDKNTWGNYLGGLAAETVLDPTNLIGAGLVGKSLRRGSALRQIAQSKTPGFTPSQVKSITGYAPQAWSDDALKLSDADWKQSLAAPEKHAISQWKNMGGTDVVPINQIARSGDSGSHRELLGALDSAIQKNSTSRTLHNYRSIAPTPGVSDVPVGSSFTDPGYFATSKLNSPDYSFYGRALPGPEKTLMDVVVPPNSPVADMSASMNQFRESEMLLPRDQRFYVAARKEIPTQAVQQKYKSSWDGTEQLGAPNHYLLDDAGLPRRGPPSNEDPTNYLYGLNYQMDDMGRPLNEAVESLSDDYSVAPGSITNMLLERVDPRETRLRRYFRRPQPLSRTAIPLASHNLLRSMGDRK